MGLTRAVWRARQRDVTPDLGLTCVLFTAGHDDDLHIKMMGTNLGKGITQSGDILLPKGLACIYHLKLVEDLALR